MRAVAALVVCFFVEQGRLGIVTFLPSSRLERCRICAPQEALMLFTRLLPFLCILPMSVVFVGQQHPKMPVVPSSCPVTKPVQPLVPPASYRPEPSIGNFWYGTEKLWTALPVAGTWSGLPRYTPTDQTYYRNKLAFWRQGYDPHSEPRPNLTVTGRRLDGPAGPLQSDGKGHGSWTNDDEFIMTGIDFPTLGCWEITGRYESDELTFVIWVAP